MISIENVSYHPSKKKNLFENLSLNFSAGNIVGLLGKNGAGKSTLLQLLSGLLTPASGSITIHNFTPHQKNPNYLTNLYLVTDEPHTPNVSIRSFIKSHGALYANFDANKMNHILVEFELEQDMKLDKISYGQRKKFIIGFALATNSKLLLLDEPTNGLDIPSKKVFRKVLVNSINEDQLVIISTHQVKDIETVIDQIVAIEDGNITFNKTVLTINEKLQFKKVPSLQQAENVLYSEKCPEGYNIICPADKNEETEVDIELLFNAINNNTPLNI